MLAVSLQAPLTLPSLDLGIDMHSQRFLFQLMEMIHTEFQRLPSSCAYQGLFCDLKTSGNLIWPGSGLPND